MDKPIEIKGAIDFVDLHSRMQSCLEDLDKGDFAVLAAQLDLIIRRFEEATGLIPRDGPRWSH